MHVLLFFHVLAAMALLASLLVCAVAAVAARGRTDSWGDVLRELAFRASIAATVATIAAIALGEGLAADEHVHANWLDVSRGLAVFGLLLGGALLTAFAATARDKPRLSGPVVGGTLVLVLAGFALAFVMAAKP